VSVNSGEKVRTSKVILAKHYSYGVFLFSTVLFYNRSRRQMHSYQPNLFVLAVSIVFLYPLTSVSSPSCDCFVTDTGSFFSSHSFYDWRSISGSSVFRAGSEPPNVTVVGSNNVYVQSNTFLNDWEITTWESDSSISHPLTSFYSKSNVYFRKLPSRLKVWRYLLTATEQNDGDSTTTHLTFRAQRSSDFAACAEVTSKKNNIFYGSFRVYARVWGDPGTVAGMFTYYNDSVESDIEILTRKSTDEIFYTNQPHTGPDGYDIPQAGINGSMPNHTAWTDWNVHRLDWLPQITKNFVNGIQTASNTYGVPDHQSVFMLNLWSNGDPDWSGLLDVGAGAYMEVQWIEILFNTSSTSSGNHCRTVCGVDNVSRLGTPEFLYSASSRLVPQCTITWVLVMSMMFMMGTSYI
jgi:hypothetical protein